MRFLSFAGSRISAHAYRVLQSERLPPDLEAGITLGPPITAGLANPVMKELSALDA
jgi:hypothetical protein